MKVLIAVNENEFADYVSDFVQSHEWPPLTEFIVMSVVEPILPLTVTMPSPVLETLSEDIWREARSVVRRVALAIRTKFHTEHVQEEVVQGRAKEQILKLAQDRNVDLMIIGSHGKTALDRFLLGSVSLAVVSHAPCSVMIVRPPTAQKEIARGEATRSKELVS